MCSDNAQTRTVRLSMGFIIYSFIHSWPSIALEGLSGWKHGTIRYVIHQEQPFIHVLFIFNRRCWTRQDWKEDCHQILDQRKWTWRYYGTIQINEINIWSKTIETWCRHSTESARRDASNAFSSRLYAHRFIGLNLSSATKWRSNSMVTISRTKNERSQPHSPFVSSTVPTNAWSPVTIFPFSTSS